jgi:hypothetical protein
MLKCVINMRLQRRSLAKQLMARRTHKPALIEAQRAADLSRTL